MMEEVKCVVFVLVKDGMFLVERRPKTEDTDPGKVAIPGGHVDAGESLEEALIRECKEELDVEPVEYKHFYEGAYPTEFENQRCHYFAVTEWKGKIRAKETGKLKWLYLSQAEVLDTSIDKEALWALRHVMG